MTVKEASQKFSLSADTIRKMCKLSDEDGIEYIKATKNKGRWKIADDTSIIMSKAQIRAVLYQILKYKNNNQHAISRRWFQDKKTENAILDHLYKLGFITYRHKNAQKQISISLDITMLTDEGFTLVLNKGQEKVISNAPTINIVIFENKNGLIVA